MFIKIAFREETKPSAGHDETTLYANIKCIKGGDGAELHVRAIRSLISRYNILIPILLRIVHRVHAR